jgi:hypothetical protein
MCFNRQELDMRRSALAFATALTLIAAAAQAQTVVTPIDQSVMINLPAPAADVVIGNSAIADVQLLNARQAVVLGKGYGVTSLQVFDALGRSIYARQIVVSSGDENRVTYYRGADVATFACASRCERTSAPSQSAAAPAGAAAPTPPVAP